MQTSAGKMLRHDAAAGARLVAGLAGLASIGMASEIASRDAPAAAAHKHKSRRGAATLQRAHIAALRSDGFVIVDGAIPLRTLALGAARRAGARSGGENSAPRQRIALIQAAERAHAPGARSGTGGAR